MFKFSNINLYIKVLYAITRFDWTLPQLHNEKLWFPSLMVEDDWRQGDGEAKHQDDEEKAMPHKCKV